MLCIKWGPDVSQVAGTHTPETCPLRKVTADAALTGPAEPGRGQPAHQRSCPERSLELEGVLTCSAYQAPFFRRPWPLRSPFRELWPRTFRGRRGRTARGARRCVLMPWNCSSSPCSRSWNLCSVGPAERTCEKQRDGEPQSGCTQVSDETSRTRY